MNKSQKKIVVGWREWVGLPQLGIEAVNAKVDTGARTSCLHTFEIIPFDREGQPWVRFYVHPVQNDIETVVCCEAKVKDRRIVRDSGGHESLRYVIETKVVLGDVVVPVEMTLTPRDNMKFRMLLGRTALAGQLWPDGRSSIRPLLTFFLTLRPKNENWNLIP